MSSIVDCLSCSWDPARRFQMHLSIAWERLNEPMRKACEVNLGLTLGMDHEECEGPVLLVAFGCPNSVEDCRDLCAAAYNFSQIDRIYTQKWMRF